MFRERRDFCSLEAHLLPLFISCSRHSCNEFQRHNRTDVSSHGEPAGKPPCYRKEACSTQRTLKTWERAEGGPIFHEAPTNETKSGNQGGDLSCAGTLLGCCMLPVLLPTGLTGGAGPRICAGLGADATSPGSQREPQESAGGEIYQRAFKGSRALRWIYPCCPAKLATGSLHSQLPPKQ